MTELQLKQMLPRDIFNPKTTPFHNAGLDMALRNIEIEINKQNNPITEMRIECGQNREPQCTLAFPVTYDLMLALRKTTGDIRFKFAAGIMRPYPVPTEVIFNGPATVCIWSDKTKTVVKCMEGDRFDREKGLMLCIMKKMLGDDAEKFHTEYKQLMKLCGTTPAKKKKESKTAKPKEQSIRDALLEKGLRENNASRICNLLSERGITTFDILLRCSPDTLKIEGIGEKSLITLLEIIREYKNKQ